MKTTIVLILLSVSASVFAADKTYFVDGKEASKVDALRALINNPKTAVSQCQQVELTDKATLRAK